MFTSLLLLFLSSADGVAVAQLGDDNFSQRECARTYLSKRGWGVRTALRVGIDGSDAEVSRACRLLYGDALDAECALLEPVPEIDSAWYHAFPRWWESYQVSHYKREMWPERVEEMEPYLNLVGRDDYPWANYYTATRLWARSRVEGGERASDLMPLLDEMRARDAVFLGEVARNRGER